MTIRHHRSPAACHRSRERDRGAVLVEFALVFPILMMLLVGTVSGGMVMNRRLEVSQATREAARYGATVAPEQCTPTSVCGGNTWAQHVRTVAVSRSDGAIESADVCVALVQGPGSAPTPVSPFHTTHPTGGACYVDDSADQGMRIQVVATYTDEIEAVLTNVPLSITTRATSKAEL